MNVSIFGLGYVGSVIAGCLSIKNIPVIALDVDKYKISLFKKGISPVCEPGLQDYISYGVKNGLIEVIEDVGLAVLNSDISFICVGTPSASDGLVNLNAVYNVIRQIGLALRHKSDYHMVVMRSTVPPGTCQNLISMIEELSHKEAGKDFGFCMNPEFLREGAAVKDFFDPPFTIIGANFTSELNYLGSFYESLGANQIEYTNLIGAELLKYACNAFHGLKVSFANEIARICRRLNIDEFEILRLFCLDRKLNISDAYLRPGFPFGGSCLPKDIKGLSYLTKKLGINSPLLNSIIPSNDAHLDFIIDNIFSYKPSIVGILGITFKNDTDDVRESPILRIARKLLDCGIKVWLYDPIFNINSVHGSNKEYAFNVLPELPELFCDTFEDLKEYCDVLIVGNTKLGREIEDISIPIIDIQKSIQNIKS